MMQTHPSDKPRIGITLGDLNGIGPEVVIKALADHRLHNLMTPVIYGSTKALSFYRKLMNLEEFNYNVVKTKGQFFPKAINVVNCWEDMIEINPGQPSRQTAKAALLSLKKAVEEVKEGLIDGFVTGPIDKNTIHDFIHIDRDYNVFELMNAIGERNTLKSMAHHTP